MEVAFLEQCGCCIVGVNLVVSPVVKILEQSLESVYLVGVHIFSFLAFFCEAALASLVYVSHLPGVI